MSHSPSLYLKTPIFGLGALLLLAACASTPEECDPRDKSSWEALRCARQYNERQQQIQDRIADERERNEDLRRQNEELRKRWALAYEEARQLRQEVETSEQTLAELELLLEREDATVAQILELRAQLEAVAETYLRASRLPIACQGSRLSDARAELLRKRDEIKRILTSVDDTLQASDISLSGTVELTRRVRDLQQLHRILLRLRHGVRIVSRTNILVMILSEAVFVLLDKSLRSQEEPVAVQGMVCERDA